MTVEFQFIDVLSRNKNFALVFKPTIQMTLMKISNQQRLPQNSRHLGGGEVL